MEATENKRKGKNKIGEGETVDQRDETQEVIEEEYEADSGFDENDDHKENDGNEDNEGDGMIRVDMHLLVVMREWVTRL